MRYLAALMIAGVMVGGMSATRADDPPAQKRRRIPPQILQQFDKNGDGKLDEAEKRAIRDSFMKRFDKNGDGKIDEAEKRAAREAFMKRRGGPGKDGKGRPGKGRPGQFDRAAILKQFDKNGDGKLDEAERQAAREAFMKRRGGRDRGKFGQGRPGGPVDGPKPRIDRAKLIEQFDADGDGKLSPEERRKAMETLRKKRGKDEE